MQLTPRSFWFSLNQTGWVKLSDALTGAALTLPRANTTRFLFGFFNGDIRRADKFASDLSNVQSCTLVLRRSDETGDLLYVRTLTASEFHNPSCSYSAWSSQSDWQVGFELSSQETNWEPLPDWDERLWIAVEIMLADGSEVTVGHGTLQMVDAGLATESDPIAENISLKASQEEAEAGTDNIKWMTPLRTGQAIVARLAQYASQSWVGSQISSAIEALGLGSAATHEASDFETAGSADAAIEALGLGSAATHEASDFEPAGSADAARDAAIAASSLYPRGSSAESSGGAYPQSYTIKNASGTVIGTVYVTYDGSNRVTAVSCTDGSDTPLTHGNFTISYDAEGNFQAATCTN